MTRGFRLIPALLTLAVMPVTAEAGQPRLLATFSQWHSYIILEGDDKVCYMASKPQEQVQPKSWPKAKPWKNPDGRESAYALITHRPSDGAKNVFSYIAGYSYKPGAEATVEVDGEKFALFTQDNTAWAPDAETDNKITKAIRAGKVMLVKGQSTKGLKTTDTIPLTGSGEAYKKIDDECY
jgi:Invasion associated locus B (IalB) protein